MDIDSARAAFDEKVRAGIFNPIARHLHDEIRDDRLAEGIAFAWRLYRTHDGDVDTALLVHHARLRACDVSRQIAGGYSRKDVLDARYSGKVEVLHLDGDHLDGDDVGLARALSSDPTHRIFGAISLKRWLEGLPEEDQRMLELRMAGCTLEETAEKMNVSTSTVFARCRRLGLELAARAGIEVRVKKNKPRNVSRRRIHRREVFARAA